MKLIEKYVEEWSGGGQKEIVACANDGSETVLAKNYIGYDEFSHGVSLHWCLNAKHEYIEGQGDVVEIQRYYLGTTETDDKNGSNGNGRSVYKYLSIDDGNTWEMVK